MVVEVGSQAPDFTLKNHLGETVRLSDFRGEKNVVVVFYPLAFSGICTGELCEIRDRGNDFTGEGVETLAISCDAPPSLKAFAEQQGLEYQLLSDFYKSNGGTDPGPVLEALRSHLESVAHHHFNVSGFSEPELDFA